MTIGAVQFFAFYCTKNKVFLWYKNGQDFMKHAVVELFLFFGFTGLINVCEMSLGLEGAGAIYISRNLERFSPFRSFYK